MVRVGLRTLAEDTSMEEFMRLPSRAHVKAKVRAKENATTAVRQATSPECVPIRRRAKARAKHSKENVT